MLVQALIIGGITWLGVLPFTLYFNYRLNRLIKMLDDSIIDRPV